MNQVFKFEMFYIHKKKLILTPSELCNAAYCWPRLNQALSNFQTLNNPGFWKYVWRLEK